MKVNLFDLGRFKTKKPKPAPKEAAPLPQNRQIIAYFGKMAFAIDAKTAKKMGIDTGAELSNEQVEELMSEKKK